MNSGIAGSNFQPWGQAMIEIAVRINQLVTSNVNSLVSGAGNPVKMLKLLVLEIEEAILTLNREANQAERRGRDLRLQADRQKAVQADWSEKARFAMSKHREDLARSALAEREAAAALAAVTVKDAVQADRDLSDIRATISMLETRLGEVRQRMAAMADSAPQPVTAASETGRSKYSERVMDRIDTISKRVDFASEAMPRAKTVSLDEELSAMAIEAKLDDEMETLRKSLKKKRT